MTLLEMSFVYRSSAETIHRRIADLRARERAQSDPEESLRIRHRINELTPLWREARDLAVLTAHYYDRGYHKDEHYTL